MDKNPQARALAFKKCKGKIQKIQELGIVPDMNTDDTDALIEQLATAKHAEDDTKSMSEHIKGQRWYVENLVDFSGKTVKEQFEAEYADAFADSASEDEMLDSLTKLAA